MEKVLYRKLVRDDYERIKELICEAFGFDKFIKDEKLLDSILTVYLQGCLLDSSFSRVAVKNNKVIGIILGNAKKDKKYLREVHNILSFLFNIGKLMLTSKENKKSLKEFSKVKGAYKDVINGMENDFEGCIQLFIVSNESQGLGVGKALVSNLFDYMKSMDVKSIYLYTDTICNYGFYDSQNFKRLNEKEVSFESFRDKLTIFLYGYNL